MKVEINAVVLTISDAAARGEKEDKAGLTLAEQLEAAKIHVVGREAIPPDRALIARRLEHYAAREDVNLTRYPLW